ncbi:hypothetical protein FK268_12550 [Tsukamurella sputi]|uniref:Minor tail protein n=1 Tax=Tsukamurella sputi TaxID=2591848 RepID=A0A5C5RPJ0_9ACTN|nr:hypothetical protein [Tsukamurella sputi]TWS24413.1 hypothetical protein FK268_12550 [Tsukamurella sputi]
MTSPDFQTPAGALSPAAMNWLQDMLAKPIGKEGKQILQALASIGDSMLSRFFKGYTDIADVFAHAFDELGAELGGIPGMSGVQAWVDDIEGLLTNALDLIDNVFTGVTDIVDGLAFAVTGRGVEGNIAEGMHMVVQGLTVFLELVNAAMDMLKELIDGVLGVAGGTMHQLVQVLSWMIGVANQFLLFFNSIYDVFAALLGFAPGGDRPLSALTNALPNLLTAFSPLNAAKLVGQLPQTIIDGLKGFLDAVLDLGNLKLTPNMIFGGDSDNLIVAAGFDTPSSMIETDQWKHDATIGHTTTPIGSARATANGTRLVQLSKPVRVQKDQKINAVAWLKWASIALASAGVAFTLEAQFYSGTTAGPSQVIATVANPAASSPATNNGFQQLAGQVTVPAGVDSMRLRIAVESRVTSGTGWWDDVEGRRTGTMPQEYITGLVSDLANMLGNFLGIGNALNGFLRGIGAPTAGGAADPILPWVNQALGTFTNQTNTTARTADTANGVGSNALTNTVAIQARLQDVQTVQDAGWTARPLWATMDYTADATFPLYLMQRQTSHTHTVTGTLSGTTNSQGGFQNFSGNTGNTTVAGESHNHSFSGGINDQHSHTVSGTLSGGTAASSASEFGAYTFTSTQAYVGFIRCGSVQEKRLFSFRAYYTAAPADFRIDVYRLDKASGTMTLLHTSSNLAGALTTSAQWVQYTIPTETAGINVQPGDILGIQFRITSGTVALQGLDSLLTNNPPGFLPRRVGMLRTGTISAPATMAESVWSAGAGFVPYVEAGIDTGQASAPLSITDNFDGSLSTQWLMSGANEIGIASNNIGIMQSGTNLADGWSWGKFNTQLRTDQAEVGITATSTSAEEQVVWFKGNGPSQHVGLAISSSYATLYTMSGGSRTNRTQIAIGTTDADYKVRYTASTKVFAVYRNGAQIGSWTDSGNVAPTGLGNRFGGVGLHATRGAWFGIGSTKANPIDNWLLADV